MNALDHLTRQELTVVSYFGGKYDDEKDAIVFPCGTTLSSRVIASTGLMGALELASYQRKAAEVMGEAKRGLEAAFAGDSIDHPPHYNQAGIECIDAIAAATVGKSGIEAVCVANVIKYLWRYEAKGKPVEDAKKARWYLERLIEHLEQKGDAKP